MAERPTRYVIEYTPRLRWEELNCVPGHPAEPDDYRDWLDVRTLRQAQAGAKRLLIGWEFAQPVIHRRSTIVKVRPDAWDYWMEEVWDESARG